MYFGHQAKQLLQPAVVGSLLFHFISLLIPAEAFSEVADSFLEVADPFSGVAYQINKIAINGRTIKNVRVNNQTETQVIISDFNSGIYFVKVKNSEGITNKKFVKE